jgi:diphthamide synthase (EF-2-diphthine--ammonia ligase)
MSEDKKRLSEHELKLVNLVRQDSLEVASALGELGFQSAIIDDQIQKLKARVIEVKAREASLIEELKEKYGNVTINIETGEIE